MPLGAPVHTAAGNRHRFHGVRARCPPRLLSEHHPLPNARTTAAPARATQAAYYFPKTPEEEIDIAAKYAQNKSNRAPKQGIKEASRKGKRERQDPSQVGANRQTCPLGRHAVALHYATSPCKNQKSF